MKQLVCIIIALIFSTACVSAPTSMQFGPAADKALIILAAPTTPSNSIEYFRSIDLNRLEFSGDAKSVEINTFRGLETVSIEALFYNYRTQLNAGDKDRNVALAVGEFEPGSYARVESVRTVGSSNYGTFVRVCHNTSGQVYTLKAGDIAIIRVDDVALESIGGGEAIFTQNLKNGRVSDDDVLQDFDNARVDYPNLVGDAIIKHPDFHITYKGGKAGLMSSRRCKEDGEIVIVGSNGITKSAHE